MCEVEFLEDENGEQYYRIVVPGEMVISMSDSAAASVWVAGRIAASDGTDPSLNEFTRLAATKIHRTKK